VRWRARERKKMKAALYRPVREDEIGETAEIFLIACADMYARHGIDAATPEPAVVEQGYRHVYETGIFHVAEVGGRIAAICNAIVRERLWFLSGFWMLPEFQRQRIGSALLKQVKDAGAHVGADTFFTWSSVDQTAMASYMKQGMLPGYQILTFAGAVRDLPSSGDEYEVQTLLLSNATALDKGVRAAAREADHNFWLSTAGHEGRQLVRDDRLIGYYYFHNGVIGPAAWNDAADAEALLAAACCEAASNSEQIKLMIPGINHTAIRFALHAGLRLSAYSHLLTTAPFGRMEQYLASGPLLF
jgi:GNAT superfamily N-acetyltransferase